jgi:hypothetical protein
MKRQHSSQNEQKRGSPKPKQQQSGGQSRQSRRESRQQQSGQSDWTGSRPPGDQDSDDR